MSAAKILETALVELDRPDVDKAFVRREVVRALEDATLERSAHDRLAAACERERAERGRDAQRIVDLLASLERKDARIAELERARGAADAATEAVIRSAEEERSELLDGVRGLTFAALRAANVARMPQFKDKHGCRVHPEDDGSDWSIADWFMSLTGEVGEFGNVAKKHKRGDLTDEEFRVLGGKELADVACYLDILAFRVGVDLGEVIVAKFNEVSERVSADVYLTPCGLPIRWSSKDFAPAPLELPSAPTPHLTPRPWVFWDHFGSWLFVKDGAGESHARELVAEYLEHLGFDREFEESWSCRVLEADELQLRPLLAAAFDMHGGAGVLDIDDEEELGWDL